MTALCYTTRESSSKKLITLATHIIFTIQHEEAELFKWQIKCCAFLVTFFNKLILKQKKCHMVRLRSFSLLLPSVLFPSAKCMRVARANFGIWLTACWAGDTFILGLVGYISVSHIKLSFLEVKDDWTLAISCGHMWSKVTSVYN